MNVYSKCKYKYFTTSISVFLNMDNRGNMIYYDLCNPKGECTLCRNGKPLPGCGFCDSCEQKGVPGSPYKFYKKCFYCNEYHVNALRPTK